MTTRYLQRPGGRLAYDVQGEGPLVITMTGMGDVRASYRFVVADLVARGYRVATVDVRGFGESSAVWPDYTHAAIADDYLALVRELGGQAILIGSSYVGGPAVIASADESVLGIVLLAGVINRTPPRGVARLLMRVMAATPFRAVWGIYYAKLYPSRKPADFEAHRRSVVANIREKGRWANISRMVLSPNDATVGLLGSVSVPTLLAYGSKDLDFADPTAELAWLHEQIPGAETLLIEGGGHYPHAERPDLLLPVLDGFLERTCRALA